MAADVMAWVGKAEGDYRSMKRELRARVEPNYDSACFHAQQCAEKYMKGCLRHLKIGFPKIHDLQVLLELLLPDHSELESFRLDANKLTQYAVFFRYPGRNADRSRAKEAAESCEAIRAAIRDILGVPDISSSGRGQSKGRKRK